MTRLNPRSVAQATLLAHEAVGTVCTPGLCAHYAVGFYGWGHSGGNAHALHQAAVAAGVIFHSYKPGDYVPPGALVLYLGPRDGHTAISAGGGMIVSTDLPHSGRFGLVSITAPVTSWGEPMPVWSEPVFPIASSPVGALAYPSTLGALPAPEPGTTPAPTVYLSQLTANRYSLSAGILNNVLVAEGKLRRELLRGYWSQAAHDALIAYREAHHLTDNAAAIRALGAAHRFTVHA